MKITGGRFKGRPLFAPKRIIRPTQDAVREAIFNIIGDSFLQDATVLDLCCGSGALGIEALSRGAKEAVFVDNKKICLLFVRKNLTIFGDGIDKKFSLIKADAFKIMKDFSLRRQKFDLILIDPPYYKNLGKKYLNALDEYDILTPNGLAIIEYFKKESLAIETENLTPAATKQYGDTKISFFKNC
jgi:16S rRNA (guanine(966)-N(2))-methyltransferase RsmD